MDKRVEDIFLTQIFAQCEIALVFAADLTDAVKREDNTRVWCSIQGFLVSAANISKMLWPSKPINAKPEVSKRRGARLRKILSVSEHSILQKRSFRDHFEHFDERLDTWAELQKQAQTGLMDGWIAYSRIDFMGEPKSLLRIFDATDLTLMFYGQKYPLEPVIKAIQELQLKVQAVAHKRLRIRGKAD